MDDTRAETVSYDDLLALLCKSIESREYQDFVKRLSEEARVDDLDFATYFHYEGLGFHIRYDNEKQLVTGITIWNANLRYSQFKGTLPGGLSFADKQKEVNKKLGLPLRTGTSRGLNFPPEPKGYSDREAAYNEWVAELQKQPVSDIEWGVYMFGAYRLKLDFDMSENGNLRIITMEDPACLSDWLPS